MGFTHVTALVRNPARPAKLWEGVFLVDTGAVDCMVPGKHLRALGLEAAMSHELVIGARALAEARLGAQRFADGEGRHGQF